jgi:acetolactate synthase-1/2/3 large subunit
VVEPAPATGAQLVLDILADEGVEVVFGYPGGANMPLYDALYGNPIEHVLTRHEAAAAFAAGGYARASGRVGVCFATSGPGATNLVTGILDAQMDSIPVVAITGQVRTTLMGTDGFQEADVTSIMGPVTKRSVCVRDVRDLERILRAAFRVARGPRPGPVLVDIPNDILKAACPRMDPFAARPVGPAAEYPDDAALSETIALLRAAKRPVAVVGGGARSANATYLFRELMAMLEMPHAATINGLGCARPGDPHFLGMLGMHGWKAANIAVSQADVLLALGMRFDDRVTGKPDKFARHAKIVHADVDASEFGKIVPIEVALRGDLRQTLERLVRKLSQTTVPTFSGWAAEARQLGGALPADRAPHGELSATDVLDAFFAVAPEDTIVATDVGQHQMWAAQRQRAIHPRNFITSAGLGSMGFGLPAAIGAQFAHRDRRVVAICGDGGFQMSLPELATLRRFELPVKILLIDNQRLGMVRQWQELFYERRYSQTDLGDNPDFVMLAAAYGIRSERVDDAGELRDALERFLRPGEPALLHCACFPAENVWPLIPPGATVDDAMEFAPPVEAISR